MKGKDGWNLFSLDKDHKGVHSNYMTTFQISQSSLPLQGYRGLVVNAAQMYDVLVIGGSCVLFSDALDADLAALQYGNFPT